MKSHTSAPSTFFVLAFIVMMVGAGFLLLHRAGAQSKDQTQPSPAAMNTTDANKDDLKSKLTPQQYHVTQQCGTEPPFNNAYWNNHQPGIYVDVISGKPLFTSLDKFDSGTGWPSFTKPVDTSEVVEKSDRSLGMERVEARSKSGDAHLGHVFDDGPRDKGGMRYCINSAALRFVPLDKLKEEGYGEYVALFQEKK